MDETSNALVKVEQPPCSFGFINMETQRFHRGYMRDGKMCFEKTGEPAMLPCDIDAKPLSFKPIIYPWWRKDKYGWPIEFTIGRPFQNFVRVIFQNIRKVTG